MKNILNGIKIMSLEGSDILKNNKDNININKDYKAVFPYSLVSEKLHTIGLKISKNNTTRDIITLNFTYGYTPQFAIDLNNKIKENKEAIKEKIRRQKTLLEERKQKINNKDKKLITDGINQLKTDVKELKQDNKNFIKEIKILEMNSEKVRNELYNEGFYLDFYKKDKETKQYKLDERIFYKFWFRSPSKSRIGEVCFINVKLLDDIRSWQTMGLQLSAVNAKLVEFEAYLSLTSSSIVDKIILNPRKELLVVSDLESYVETMCSRVLVKTISDAEGNKSDVCDVKDELMKVKSVLWDGMALLDSSYFTGISKMKLLRQHFFKACGFSCFISKFFKDWCKKNDKDYNTYTIKDRYKRELYVKDIKCITTENAMKWEKFSDIGGSFDYWCDKVEEDGNTFGICKEEHESKYKEYQRMSYQHINSLPISKEQTIELCNSTIEYVNSLKDNNDEFIDFLNRTKSDVNANEMMIALYNRNNKFAGSELFRTYKTSKISEYKETLRAGKLLCEGDNLTICGNPYVLLLHSVGEVPHSNNVLDENYIDSTLPKLDKGYSVYTTKFNEGQEIVMFRNPHNSPNNILLGKVYKHDLMSEYMDFSDNIIAVNMIRTDVQARANGMDEDSDFCLCTTDNITLEAAHKALQYNTIVNDIPESKIPYNNTMNDLAKIDIALARGKYAIGLSSNLAQLALSWYWKSEGEEKEELKKIVCIASVLAQIAIDNSKRMYKIDLNKEIERINKLKCMNVKKGKYVAKPYFWQFVKEIKEKKAKADTLSKEEKDELTKEALMELERQLMIEAKTKEKKKKKEKEKDLKKHCIDGKICPMDWIQDGIEQIKNNYTDKNYLDNFQFIEAIQGKADDKQRNKIKDIVRDLDNLYKAHFDMMDVGLAEDDESWEVEQLIKTKDTLDKIEKFDIKPKTMQMLICDALKSNKKYKRKLLNCLYMSFPDLFLQCFKSE